LLAGLGGHRWRKNGLKMVAIGLGAAAAGFLIGRLFHTAGP
jgi:VIT1/CCC1 family predicted Fe2+/Mn2+ transporter